MVLSLIKGRGTYIDYDLVWRLTEMDELFDYARCRKKASITFERYIQPCLLCANGIMALICQTKNSQTEGQGYKTLS